MSRLCLDLDLEAEVDASVLHQAEQRAREAAVIHLQQEGEISISAAARLLEVSYEGYLDRLDALGLPACTTDAGAELVERIAGEFEGRRPVAA